jgi:hypothetical protein
LAQALAWAEALSGKVEVTELDDALGIRDTCSAYSKIALLEAVTPAGGGRFLVAKGNR